MAARASVDPRALSPTVPTRYLNVESLRALFAFGLDMQPRPVAVNRLDDPVLFRYFRSGWHRFND
jgi:predicted membrane-bound spermidine synthase